ncbi:hypothetical protein B005_3282 [Nocardiopsis alba ATCC BAA-2165]|uniref:Uncharacterized protein n=1 Tax=Nocardiopsis alba (strain ATCC BAA-2165 / BE74) TaxID=1205910 RepID=J7LBD3_NOCAA|nr:hypothetical protein B005_3282 [Nocardiopsis alba ATCC BAA-2165]
MIEPLVIPRSGRTEPESQPKAAHRRGHRRESGHLHPSPHHLVL